jgi:hypothetical protein
MTRGGARGRRVEPVKTRTRIDDGGRSKLSDLGEGEDDSGGSGSGCRAWTGEARAGPSAEMAREVHAWRQYWRR